MTDLRFERSAVISGVGQSRIGRRLPESGTELAVAACLAAIADAGLTPADIDGLTTFPGFSTMPGFSPAGVFDVQDALRLDLAWYAGSAESASPCGSVVAAVMAVATGLCRHVVCFRVHNEAAAQGRASRASAFLDADQHEAPPPFGAFDPSWNLPFGSTIVNQAAMCAARHFHQFGTTREQLGQIALTGRANAALNPNALYREPMSLANYIGARMISWPITIFDCDVPCDAATALVISSAATTADLRRPPIRFEAIGSAIHQRFSWDQWDDVTSNGGSDSARAMWARTDLGPGDVDVALLYDGFSIFTLQWLEALGFCRRGEGGRFVEGGTSIARSGTIPINPHGGLSAGRVHGNGLFFEACRQLWGEAGDRQLDRTPEVAVVAAGGGPTTAAFLLTR